MHGNVEFDNVLLVSDEIKNNHTKLVDIFANMKTIVSDAHTAWSSDVSDTVYEQFEQLTKDFDSIELLVSEHAATLDAIVNEGYVPMETQIQTEASELDADNLDAPETTPGGIPTPSGSSTTGGGTNIAQPESGGGSAPTPTPGGGSSPAPEITPPDSGGGTQPQPQPTPEPIYTTPVEPIDPPKPDPGVQPVPEPGVAPIEPGNPITPPEPEPGIQPQPTPEPIYTTPGEPVPEPTPGDPSPTPSKPHINITIRTEPISTSLVENNLVSSDSENISKYNNLYNDLSQNYTSEQVQSATDQVVNDLVNQGYSIENTGNFDLYEHISNSLIDILKS